MSDPATIAQDYLAAWNETDAGLRLSRIQRLWTDDATYVDPLASVQGHDGLDQLIAGVQQRFPGFRFRLLGAPDGYGEQVRFAWGLGLDAAEPPIKGFDVVTLKDGRIGAVIGFLDQVPAAA